MTLHIQLKQLKTMYTIALFISQTFNLINSRRQPPNGYYLGALLLTIQKEYGLYWCAIFIIKELGCIGALSFFCMMFSHIFQ